MNKEISIKTFFLILMFLVLIECVIMCLAIPHVRKANLKSHCEKAVCNDDLSVCFNYEANDASETTITWRGNCSKLK